MATTLIQWTGHGLAADLPNAATLHGDLPAVDATARYYAYDTGTDYVLDRDAIAWVAIGGPGSGGSPGGSTGDIQTNAGGGSFGALTPGSGVVTFLATPSSANLRSALTDETGTGAAVFATSPTLVTPALGTPSAIVLTNGTGLPIGTGVSGLGTSVATFLGTPSSANLRAALTDETGTGAAVFANSPALITPDLGIPSAIDLTNATNVPSSVSPAGSSGDIQTNNGSGGLGAITPAAGIATWLATPSSANLRAAITDETGTGAAVFATSPALTTPNLGTPSAITLTSATGLPISTGISGLGSGVATFLATPSSANLRAALTDETGTGAAVFANSPTLVTPDLGIPSAIDLTNATNVPGSGFNAVTKAADYTVLSGDSGKDFNNAAAGADIVLSLPAAVVNRLYGAAVHDAFYIKFLSDGTDKIAIGSDNSAAGGYVRSNLPYSYIELRCHVAGQWVASSLIGNWGIDL